MFVREFRVQRVRSLRPNVRQAASVLRSLDKYFGHTFAFIDIIYYKKTLISMLN
jgi:hypothetical protein